MYKSRIIVNTIAIFMAIVTLFSAVGKAKDKNVILETNNLSWKEWKNIEVLNGAINQPITTITKAIEKAQTNSFTKGMSWFINSIKNFNVEIEDNKILNALIQPINWISSLTGFMFNLTKELIIAIQTIIFVIGFIIIPD